MKKEISETEILELRKLAEAATPGPWDNDGVIRSDGSFGSGEGAREGYNTYAIYEPNGKVILDFLNSEIARIEEEYDDEGHYAWDTVAQRNAAFIAASNPAVVLSLIEEIRALRKGLEPFAAIGAELQEGFSDEKSNTLAWAVPAAKHFRRAKSLLEGEKKNDVA